MSHEEIAIEKVCRFAFFFSNIDTVFIDAHSQIKWEFGHHQLPEPLKVHFGVIYNRLQLHEMSDDEDVFFHSSTTRMNFISSPIYAEKQFLGSVVVGPYLLEEPSALMIHDVLFENNLSISLKHMITQYYASLPIISTYKAKVIGEFLAHQTLNLPSISIQSPRVGHLTYNFETEMAIPSETMMMQADQSSENIENRYAIQKALMNAVEQGDSEMVEKLVMEDFNSGEKIPDRVPNDPLRSRKNMEFVFNTILRIAAEKGGLHPIYIHSISEKFAIQIEKTTSIQRLNDLHHQMAREYSTAVKKLSLKKFNYIVRKAIEFIRIHLDDELTLEIISSAIQLSPYELSRQFKKETGQSLTDYINKQRINEAILIMESHHLNITEIAQMVGFNDVNYFTKVFKKFKGITPSKFRKGEK